jgi:hypothetical protein
VKGTAGNERQTSWAGGDWYSPRPRPPTSEVEPAVAAFVEQGAKALGRDPAYTALPTLAAIAGTIGNTRAIRLKRTWEEPAVVWTVTVGDSGTLKSPAYAMAVGHLLAVQHQLLARFNAV